MRQVTVPSGPCWRKRDAIPLPDRLPLFQDQIMIGEACQHHDVLVDDEDRLAG